MRGMPAAAATPLVSQHPGGMPAARSSRRVSAMPAAEDDLVVPDVTGPPPALIATCMYLGAPLVLATMAVAVLALR
jgi:hypothetical protein